MYKQMSELVVRIADLAEAEGRVLRQVVARMGLGLSLTVVGAALALSGLVLVLAGVWLFVDAHHGSIWACIGTGVITLLIAAGVLFLAAKLNKE